jgi:hypothetical protein
VGKCCVKEADREKMSEGGGRSGREREGERRERGERQGGVTYTRQ